VGLRLIAVVCLFVTVTVVDEVDPTATLGRVRLVGLKVRGAIPVPDSFTSCGLVVAPSVKVSTPVIAATTLGLKVTSTVQLTFAASTLGQLFVSLKSPLAAIEPIESAPVPELVRVTVFSALAIPAAPLPKAKLFGLIVAAGVPLPEPIST
jgi:hypothetical protein